LHSRFPPYLCPAILALVPALLCGCATRSVVVRAMGPVLEDVARSVDEASDLELVERGLPANLLLLRGLLKGSPENRSLLLLASRACYGYAFAFVEDEDTDRAAALYREGLAYAARALDDLLHGADPVALTLRDLQATLSKAKPSAVPGLFWLANNWGRWIQLEAGQPRMLAQLPKAVAAMETVLAMNEGYFHGGPHLFFGVYHGARGPTLGSDVSTAASHLDRAIELSRGEFLLARVYRALYVHAANGDRAAFTEDLRAVQEYPVERAPSVRFYNEIARREARELQSTADELFELFE
jgi:hypothetical protein